MDSDEENEVGERDGESAPTPTVSLTGFIFGNIDEKGHLVDDVLDEVCI